MSNEELKRQVEEAWEAIQHHQYEVVEPRFYKERKKGRGVLINPWKTLEERMAAEAVSKELYWNHHELYVRYFQETGERLPVERLYKEQETPDGIRYIRR